MTRINTNVSSLVAQNRLNRTNNDLQTSLTRLSTGLRINTGKDDPAGLIASEALRSDITSINKAISNTQRASQIIATADSALGQVSSLLNDVRGLVTEAANSGALSDDEIAANQLQIDSSLEAINRIAQTTTFQGRRLLDGSLDFITQGGSGFGTVSDLKIDQANLGASGSISVEVDINQAASKASVINTGIAATGTAANSTGTITFGTPTPDGEATIQVSSPNAFTIGDEASRGVSLTNASTPDGEAEYTTVTIGSTNSVEFTIGARDGGIADGTAGNDLNIQVLTTSSVGGTASSYDANSNTLTLTIEEGLTGTAAATALNATAVGTNTWEFTATTNAGSTIVNGDADVAPRGLTASTPGTDLANGGTVNFNLNAVNGGAADGAVGNSTTLAFTSGASTAASYDADANAVTVTVADGATINDIVTAINTNLSGTFQATDVANGSYTYVDGTNTGGPFTGGTNPTAAGSFSIEAVNGKEADGTVANSTSFTYTAGTSTGATYDADTNTVAVTYSSTATVDDIASAITGITSAQGGTIFNLVSGSTLNGTSRFNATGTTESVTTPGTDSTVDDVITVTAATAGAEFDNTISFATDNSLAAGVANAAVDSNGNITVTTSNAGDVNLSTITNAINDLADYNASITTSNGDGIYSVGTDTAPTIVDPTGGSQGGGLDADLVFQLTGGSGSETFQFEKGATIENVVQSINLVSDATGVEARVDSGNLRLESDTYGSDSVVAIEVISEGTGGGFTTGLSAERAVGTDIAATVNGFTATGDGNTLSINTASLDLELTVSDGSSTTVNFDITGGGALFQLGGDVVSNQQARLGIGSLNTAKLGSASGRLYELASGGAKSLTNDITGAAKVIDEVVNKVTSLRGRLGAFQATTLESNLTSLNDTVANLTEAESSIRDADFAAESARLTRAQILVQSGTSVLGIANQNPQNVLGLLR